MQSVKSNLRRAFAAARDAMPQRTRRAKSALIARQLSKLDVFAEAGAVFCYMSVGSEAETGGIIAAALSAGKTVGVPKVVSRGVMEFSAINAESAFEAGAFGISEPLSGETLSPSRNDIVIVPGLIFDTFGCRLGYGGGYYDRYLAKAARCARVGLCFSAQLSWTALPRGPHDILMDFVVTEGFVVAPKAEHDVSED